MNRQTDFDPRPDLDDEEPAINVTKFKEMLPYLEEQFQKKQTAAEDYKVAIEGTAQTTGASKSALKKLVEARIKDTVKSTAKEAQILLDLTEAVGES
ncbi:hypothetical protein [Methylococcus mesophilus]|uniref:hypothetical protein n=1 Tax=Methylococcus mesophilus TaxID=2993564 RepID=UPI00224B1C33|nr:hypothetical protein [Methylococcus mesophilus]UZR29064.1 hypothetical protein OOT43_00125 [Methylococcus mesophilus]